MACASGGDWVTNGYNARARTTRLIDGQSDLIGSTITEGFTHRASDFGQVMTCLTSIRALFQPSPKESVKTKV